jgi:hypothetical protein
LSTKATKEVDVRRIVLWLALVGALVVPAAASAQPVVAAKAGPPPVICGTACDGGGGGWTGCTQSSGDDGGGVGGIAAWHHYLIVNYCKVNGWITSLSIVAHGCDTSGFAYCNVGPAWISSGGVGTGWGIIEGRAYYGTTINRVTGLSYTSSVHVWIYLG